MKYYAGIDLHSTNSFISVLDEQGKELMAKRSTNDLNKILIILKPYKESIAAVIVESTYNWYWLVDGLQENDYPVKLANPAAISQYDGIKHTNDHTDACYLAELARLDILPTGYIHPKEFRYLRDLCRTRVRLVRDQTRRILSLQSMFARHCNVAIKGEAIRALTEIELARYFTDRSEFLSARSYVSIIKALVREIKIIEKELHNTLKTTKDHKRLKKIPGVGDILAKIALLETGDIRRFKSVGNYASYCRCVESKRISNKKIKGKNNAKNGNAYLHWVFMEGANYAIRFYPEVKSYYQRKLKKAHRVSALNAVAHKLARATYFILRDNVEFDMKKLFP